MGKKKKKDAVKTAKDGSEKKKKTRTIKSSPAKSIKRTPSSRKKSSSTKKEVDRTADAPSAEVEKAEELAEDLKKKKRTSDGSRERGDKRKSPSERRATDPSRQRRSTSPRSHGREDPRHKHEDDPPPDHHQRRNEHSHRRHHDQQQQQQEHLRHHHYSGARRSLSRSPPPADSVKRRSHKTVPGRDKKTNEYDPEEILRKSTSKADRSSRQPLDEYDPEKMLKKSLVSSKVCIPERPRKQSRCSEGNKKLVLRAVADAGRSIAEKQMEDRARNEELEAIHTKRAQLSRALREGKLNQDKIEEINRKIASKDRRKIEGPQRKSREDRVEQRKHDSGANEDKKLDRGASNQSGRKRRLKEDELIPEKLHSTDLRHRLGVRKSQQEPSKDVDEKVEDPKSSGLKVQVKSGLKIRIRNDRTQNQEVEDERSLWQPPSKDRSEEPLDKVKQHRSTKSRGVEELSEEKKKKKRKRQKQRGAHVKDEDDLEQMRRRALESMKSHQSLQEKTKDQHPEPSSDHRGREGSPDQKKILVPLNDDSSDDDTDVETGAAEKDTPDESASSSSSNSTGDETSSELSLSEEEDCKNAPRFIVTLNGVNKDYFKKRRKQPETEMSSLSEPSNFDTTFAETSYLTAKNIKEQTEQQAEKPTAPVMGQMRKGQVQKPPTVKKPEAKVAPLRPPAAAPATAATTTTTSKMPAATTKSEEKKVGAASNPRSANSTSSSSRSSEKRSEEGKEAANKPKRTRITAPEPDHRVVGDGEGGGKLFSSMSQHVNSSSVCRYWPNCSRGSSCFYFHPQKSQPHHFSSRKSGFHSAASSSHRQQQQQSSSVDKFRWTSASVRP